jgi:hypothetical protein
MKKLIWIFIVVLLLAPVIHAQEFDTSITSSDQQGEILIPVQEDQTQKRIKLNNAPVELENISSLFLTNNEILQLEQALLRIYTRPPTPEEVEREQELAEEGKISRPSSVREISLGGILYKSSNDWAIWINSEKITPKNIPPAIMDISVQQDLIKLKWLDFQTNQIFPVKLRPHQRFNFDTRIFLPGK